MQVPKESDGSGGTRPAYYPENWYQHIHSPSLPENTFITLADALQQDQYVAAISKKFFTPIASGPVSCPPNFFGINTGTGRSTGSTPKDKMILNNFDSVGLGGINVFRTHDSGYTTWKDINPASGVFDWSYMDYYMDQYYGKGVILRTIYQTPQWASARPNDVGPYSSLGWNAEPADFNTLFDYVSAEVQRYKDRGTPLTHLEVCNEPMTGSPGPFWSGTKEKLSEYVRTVAQAAKAIDPNIKILSPSVTGLGEGTPVQVSGQGQYFIDMMSASDGAGGVMRDWVDIVNYHGYYTESDTQKLINKINNFKNHCLVAGVSEKPMWDTETGKNINVSDDDYVVFRRIIRQHIIDLAMGAQVVCWYQAGNPSLTSGYSIMNRPNLLRKFAEFINSIKLHGIDGCSLLADGRILYSVNDRFYFV